MNENAFNTLALISVVIVLIGIVHGLLGFFYQFRLTFYLTKVNPDRIRRISRVYSPFNPIQFIAYVFNDDDCDDKIIDNYKKKLRYFLKVFLWALVIFGLLFALSAFNQ